MMLFIIGAIGYVIISILAFFVPTVYTQDWGYASIIGIGKGYSQSGKTFYTLVNILGVLAIILIALVAIVMVLYIVLLITKNSNIIPKFVIFITGLLPIFVIIAASSVLAVDAKFQNIGGVIVGSGSHSGLTSFGYILCFLTIVCYILVSIGLSKFNENLKTKPTEVKTIKVKAKKKIEIDEDNFSM